MAGFIIPIDRLSSEALQGVIEEFVSRDGTDYGEREAAPEAKYRQVKEKLEKGLAVLVFDNETETTNILPADDPILGKIGEPGDQQETQKGSSMDEAITKEQRIRKILGTENLYVSLKSLTLYREYLRRSLDMPCVMTGVECSAWEDKDIVGLNGAETPKEKQPSPADTYELKRFEDRIDEAAGILVKVKRARDNARFILELASLKAADETSKNYTLLDDYAVWFANYVGP